MKDHKNIQIMERHYLRNRGILLLIIGSTIQAFGVYTASEYNSYLINIPIFLITAAVLLLLYSLLTRYVEGNDACKIAPRKDISSIGKGFFRWLFLLYYSNSNNVTMQLLPYKSIQFDWEKQTLLLYFILPCSCIRGNFLQRYPLPHDKQTMEPMGCIGYFSLNLWWIAYIQRLMQPLWSSIAIAIEAGSLLGAAYAYSKNLWLPIGIHWIWNYTQGNILGFPVSGGDNVTSVITPEISGPQWLTGGSFGAEASVIAAVIGLLISLWFIRKVRQQEHCGQ